MKGLLFTYLMAFGGALIAPFRPFVGLLIYVCFAILKPNALWSYAGATGNYSRIIFGALFLGWVMSGFGGADKRFGRAAAPCAALALYLLWNVLSSFGAADPDLAWKVTEATAKTIIPLLIGVTLIDSKEKLRQLAWVVVATQGYLALEFNVSYYDGSNRLVNVGFAALDDKSVAMTMAVSAGLALFVAIDAQNRFAKWAGFAAAAVMMHVPLFVFARGAMLAMVCAGAFAFWLIPKRPAHVLVMVCALAVGLRLAGGAVRSQFATSFAAADERDDSAQSRLVLWNQAWQTMLRFPVFGLGPRQWGNYSTTAFNWEKVKEVHNTWLQSGAELGFPGLLSLASFFGITAMHTLRLSRTRDPDTDPRQVLMAQGVLVSLVAYFVSSQFVTVYGIEVPYYVCLVGLGLLKLESEASEATVPKATRALTAHGLSGAVRNGAINPALRHGTLRS